MDHFAIDPTWWVTVVELPVLGGMALMLWRARQDADRRMDGLEHRLDVGLGQSREALSAYKLEVAKSYVTTATLKKLADSGRIGADERVVIVITGEGLKTLDAVRGTFECREIDPNFDQFEATAEHRTEVSV